MSEHQMRTRKNKPLVANGFFQKNFGVLITASVSFAAILVSATQLWVAYINKEKEFQLNTIERSRAIISEASRHLGARKNGDIDLETRLSGITSLRLLTIERPPFQYYEAAVDLLVTYIRTNLPKRKAVGVGVVEKRGRLRAEDIVAALKALQKIQKAGKGTIQVTLNNLDFDNLNLDDLDLSGFDFTHSTFKKAFLARSNLQNTILLHTKFEEAAFWNTDFTGANFSHAVFRGAQFAGAVLKDTNIEAASDLNVKLFINCQGLTDEQKRLFSK